MPHYQNPKIPNQYFYKKRKVEIINMIVNGWDREAIIQEITEKYETTPHTSAVEYNKAKRKLDSYNLNTVKEYMLSDHLLKYEDLYKRARSRNWNNIAMKALKQKENLLNVAEEYGMQLDKKELSKNLESQEFNVDLLDKKDQEELKSLLEKVEKKSKK